MPDDDFGQEIKVGDTLILIVGIPGREVVVKVEDRKGKIVAVNAEGSMSLTSALRYFTCERKN